jgi:hypothetical protein
MIYTVKHPDIKGQLRVMCDQESKAVQVYFDCRPLLEQLVGILLFTFDDALLDELRGRGFTVAVSEPELSVSQRISLWCRLYKQHKGTSYRILGSDAGKMRDLKVDEELLNYYLNDAELPQNSTTWLWRGKQSISNLVRYQNEVRASMVAPAQSKHPNVWSRDYYMKLDGAGITEYMAHLRGLGLVARKHRDGSIIDFIPASHGTD